MMDDDRPRFYVSTIEGYPIRESTSPGSGSVAGISASVIDRFYGTEHGRFASWEQWRNGKWHDGGFQKGGRVRGRRGALLAAVERCAELNAWDEREGDEEYVPLADHTG